MTERKMIVLIYAISLAISIYGFIIDSDPRVPNVFTNVFEILMMSFVVCVPLLCISFIALFAFRAFRKRTVSV